MLPLYYFYDSNIANAAARAISARTESDPTIASDVDSHGKDVLVVYCEERIREMASHVLYGFIEGYRVVSGEVPLSGPGPGYSQFGQSS
jgi:hypothetical protein